MALFLPLALLFGAYGAHEEHVDRDERHQQATEVEQQRQHPDEYT
jgi:hypothetical protein